jgi:thiol-disulfide isomerase/thioredoxin
MRPSISALSLPVALLSLTVLSPAQARLPLPGCEPAPQVSQILDEKLDYDALEQMEFSQRWALERQVLDGLTAKYPRELKSYESLRDYTRSEAPEEYPALRDRWIKMAKDNPDDPLALLLASEVLVGKDTPEAIRMAEAAREKAPDFPWPALQLATIYFSGKHADTGKLKENLEAFFALCPASTDNYAQWLLTKDQPLQPQVATALRASLEKETDPKRLEKYETLWGLEFRTRPPAQHDALRAQVAADLKRMEALNPHGDAKWQAFLISGYKQSGASKETIAAVEDRLLREYPHSSEAYRIVYERWAKEHKEPEDGTDTAAWTKYEQDYMEALKGWIRDFTGDTFLQRYSWFLALEGYNSIPVSEKDGIAAMDAYLRSRDDFEAPDRRGSSYEGSAEFLIDHRWQPKRALDLLAQAREASDKEQARDQENDNQTDQEAENANRNRIYEEQTLTGLVLKAAKQAGEPEAAMKLRDQIEGPPPTEKKYVSGYWLNRARFEAVQGHTQDALAYYQVALQTRLAAPKAYYGKVQDDLTDEARALWKAQGGSDDAWAFWSKPPAGSAEQLAEGRWEKPTKPIPEFELSDLSGKTWRLKELGGKTLLINLWATWCGPCQAELPHLEKFYEKVKNRSDIQVLTFDVDEDLGLVEPFMKEKGYTFPVLPAYSTVVSLLDGFAIPQTWLVDGHGAWQWKQIGYGGGSEADFEKDMLARLDAIETNQPVSTPGNEEKLTAKAP